MIFSENRSTFRDHALMRDTASGDPAMALRSSIRLARTDLSVRLQAGGLVLKHDPLRTRSSLSDHVSAATSWRATSPPHFEEHDPFKTRSRSTRAAQYTPREMLSGG